MADLRTPNEEYLHGDIEGAAKIVGKVSRVLKPGEWKPFLSMAGLGMMGRAQRRAMERTPPEPGKEDQYLHDPALILDVLAIYR